METFNAFDHLSGAILFLIMVFAVKKTKNTGIKNIRIEKKEPDSP